MALTLASYGGGTNSTALLVELANRGERPDLILFADTGGERPETYRYLELFSAWLKQRGFPEITVVRKVRRDQTVQTLEENCLEKKMLPSLAYGFKSCSQKFKVQPQDKFVNNWPPAAAAWKRGEQITKLIGYDAGEERRAKNYSDEKYLFRYPLIEWGWYREECVAAIGAAGLPLPGKSACFFCPASRKPEILALRDQHPALLQRALRLEANAELTSIKGLGRRFNWGEFIRGESPCSIDATDDVPCGCYDGGGDD
jgi:hypothetical protein